MLDYVPYFEEQIKIQQDAISSFKKWMTGFVVLGVMVIVAALTIINSKWPGTATPIISLGGVFIGALAAFPYREITPRRSKIVSYILLKKNFEQFGNLPSDDQQRLRDLAAETIKNNIK